MSPWPPSLPSPSWEPPGRVRPLQSWSSWDLHEQVCVCVCACVRVCARVRPCTHGVFSSRPWETERLAKASASSGAPCWDGQGSGLEPIVSHSTPPQGGGGLGDPTCSSVGLLAPHATRPCVCSPLKPPSQVPLGSLSFSARKSPHPVSCLSRAEGVWETGGGGRGTCLLPRLRR